VNPRTSILAVVFLCAFVAGVPSVRAAGTADADSAFAHRDWAAAAKGYEAAVRARPDDARAWFRLAAASAALERWPRAIEAYRRADGPGTLPASIVRYNLACAFARAGERDSALTRLESLVAGGYRQVAQLEADTDFASIRGDARFTAVVEKAKRNAEPCAYEPRSREFDFWIGDWNVTSNLNGGAQAGKSHVERILGQCVIFENWTGRFGSGKSLNAWNPDLECWQQTWMDDAGHVTNYGHGRLVDGAMQFLAEDKNPAGKWVRRRLTFYPLGPDEVRQLGERSEDEGKTWKVDYDLDYRRVGPGGAAGR